MSGLLHVVAWGVILVVYAIRPTRRDGVEGVNRDE